MRGSRRWLAAFWLALGLLPGVERILVAHVHGSARPEVAAAAHGAGAGGEASEAWLDCAACHARATLGALVVDAHPERHGAAPTTPAPALSEAPPAAPHLETPPPRGPPHPIV